jgi:hypothetical protein
MAVNPDPFNTSAIFGTAAPMASNGVLVPQASPRLPSPKSGARLSPNLRKALGDAFIADAFADWQIWGPVAIEKMRCDDPTAYVKMMAAILPKEVAFEHKAPLAELTDEQLAAVYASFQELPAPADADAPDPANPASAPEPTEPSGPESASGPGDETPGGPEISN